MHRRCSRFFARCPIRLAALPAALVIGLAVGLPLGLPPLGLPPLGAAPETRDGFRLADGTRAWTFPADHGRHDPYRLEWWYYTGLVRSAEGREFGFQVTFFRQGILPARPVRDSGWATGSVYAAHAALSEPADGRFAHEGRAARDSLGMAGAAPDAQRVWLGSWRAEPLADAGRDSGPHDLRLSVPGDGLALELVLRAGRAPLLHGAGGLDTKGDATGDASWYYSLPRLAVTGTVRFDGVPVDVVGMAWMDHEFSSSQLGAGQVGWDWMGLRLGDGSDLMLYRLRMADGGVAPASGGTWAMEGAEPHSIRLGGDAPGRLEPLRWWESPHNGARYPVEWRVTLDHPAAVLRIEPLMDAQEMLPTVGIPFAYWEGAVRVSGTVNGRAVRGEGFLELTGYSGDVSGTLRRGEPPP